MGEILEWCRILTTEAGAAFSEQNSELMIAGGAMGVLCHG